MTINKMFRLNTIVLFSSFLALSGQAADEKAAEKSKTPTETAAATKTEKTKKTEPKKGDKVSTQNPHVVVETSMGTIEIELNKEKAPITVENFLKYTDAGFYNGTIFHRVIDNFMIQGGGFTKDMSQKPTEKQIQNEAKNGLGNDKYTIAMARTAVVNSATAQFFINVKNNDFLNHRPTGNDADFGYAVFGKVVAGQDVVDKIKAVKTGTKAGMGDVPLEVVEIKSVKRK